MKVHSAYLQNQIPEGPKAVRPENAAEGQTFKEIVKQKNADDAKKQIASRPQLDLSENTARILSASEKEIFALLYEDALKGMDQTYDQAGRTQEQAQFAMGQKIDVKG